MALLASVQHDVTDAKQHDTQTITLDPAKFKAGLDQLGKPTPAGSRMKQLRQEELLERAERMRQLHSGGAPADIEFPASIDKSKYDHLVKTQLGGQDDKTDSPLVRDQGLDHVILFS